MAPKLRRLDRGDELPSLLRALREEADLTQAQLGERLERAQQWIHSSETANRRVDVGEFVEWARACETDPVNALRRLIRNR